jgi:hypothetical protein
MRSTRVDSRPAAAPLPRRVHRKISPASHRAWDLEATGPRRHVAGAPRPATVLLERGLRDVGADAATEDYARAACGGVARCPRLAIAADHVDTAPPPIELFAEELQEAQNALAAITGNYRSDRSDIIKASSASASSGLLIGVEAHRAASGKLIARRPIKRRPLFRRGLVAVLPRGARDKYRASSSWICPCGRRHATPRASCPRRWRSS